LVKRGNEERKVDFGVARRWLSCQWKTGVVFIGIGSKVIDHQQVTEGR
jgi:hypothetical protein